MKKLICITLIILLSGPLTILKAQKTMKFGHLDFAELYTLMPEKDSAQAQYQKFAKDLEATMKSMQTEFETKYQDFQTNQATMSNLIQQTKTKELQDLQQRIQEFQQNAQQELIDKEKELSTPIIEKAKKAVQEIAKENGYTYIFNSAEGLLLYSDPGDDIMPMAKKKLGLK